MPSVSETTTPKSPSSPERPSPPAALLRLPPTIRRRIYLFVGLAQWDGYPYTYDLHGRQVCFRNPPPPGTFTGLLRSCRTLHAEAAALLYSANRFIIHYSHPGSLAPLRAFTVPSLASLTSLKIVLNQSSCHHRTNLDGLSACCRHGREDEDWGSGAFLCKRHHGDMHSPPLLSSSSGQNRNDMAAVHAMLDEWHSTAAPMAFHVTPGRLELSLVCDVNPDHEQGLNVANRAVAPLALLPPMKDCHIRLCRTPDPRLQQLAKDAAMRARGIAPSYCKPSSSPATLLSLPAELRLRILEYTDLITPWREVAWDRHRRGYAVYHIECRHEDGFDCEPVVHAGCQFRRCWLHVDIEPRIGCFCSRHHSASSSRCKCWAPPGPGLFLICRTLHRDAQFVFFSGNRFIVHDFDLDHPARLPEAVVASPGDYPYNRFAISQFLKEVVPTHCLAHIRFLDFVFPPYPHNSWPHPEHPAMQDWRMTVEWLRDKINAPGLTIRLIMEEASRRDIPPNRKVMTKAQGMAIIKAYLDILGPLKHLTTGDNPLARFHAKLAYPWSWTEATYDRIKQPDGYEWYKSEQQELNERGERYVMGDRYQSPYADNGEVPAPSPWEVAIRRYY